MDLYDIKTAYPANSAVRAATARRNSRTSPEEEPQCPRRVCRRQFCTLMCPAGRHPSLLNIVS